MYALCIIGCKLAPVALFFALEIVYFVFRRLKQKNVDILGATSEYRHFLKRFPTNRRDARCNNNKNTKNPNVQDHFCPLDHERLITVSTIHNNRIYPG